jgi:hypothetical protein
MCLKPVITLLLALVFQIGQMVPAAVLPQDECALAAVPCECCAGPSSCHCASDDGPVREQQPPIHPGASVKAPVIKLADTRVAVETSGDITPPATATPAQAAAPVTGYHGVRLSVAFCSFVI